MLARLLLLASSFIIVHKALQPRINFRFHEVLDYLYLSFLQSNISNINVKSYVTIQQFCYFGLLRSDSQNSMLNYLYHLMIHIFKEDKEVYLIVLLECLLQFVNVSLMNHLMIWYTIQRNKYFPHICQHICYYSTDQLLQFIKNLTAYIQYYIIYNT